jgi:hypothetical protein
MPRTTSFITRLLSRSCKYYQALWDKMANAVRVVPGEIVVIKEGELLKRGEIEACASSYKLFR